MGRDRTTPFPSWAALILALAVAACSQQSPPVTTAKTAPPAAPPKQAAPTPPAPQPAPARPAEPVAPAAEKQAGKPFTEGELAGLLAPIALYPDNVVAQILMASTYPLEVIEARRWLQKNKQLKPEELAAAAQKQDWEDSVKSLVAAPDVLKQMDENLGWMQKLGDAFLAQQEDVFDMVQTLRAKAMKEGTLKSDEHMKVTTKPAEATATATTVTTETMGEVEKPPEIIVIESSDPEVIYVPTYSPASMYGYWGYGYPPYYWPPPYGYPGYGFWWGMSAGIIIGGVWGDCCWGGDDIDIDWNGGDINIDRGDRGNRVEHHRGEGGRAGDRAGVTDRSRQSGEGGRQKWSHSPEHRKGVSYRDNATASRFDRGAAGAGSREGFRGRTGGGNVGSGSRPGAGTRPSAGTTGSGGRGRSSAGSSTWGGSRGSGAFGGMSGGSRAGSYGSRGGMSRGGGGGRGGGGRRR
ncbi:MAG TPA: DUF3300 domain-containing protein [Thermoanaerobaculia bacterium]